MQQQHRRRITHKFPRTNPRRARSPPSSTVSLLTNSTSTPRRTNAVASIAIVCNPAPAVKKSTVRPIVSPSSSTQLDFVSIGNKMTNAA